MSTFGQDAATTDNNAKAAQSGTPKDDATKTDIENADKAVENAGEDNTDDETAAEAADRHIASTELPVGDVTDPETQALEDREDPDSDFETAEAAEAAEKIVPGAKEGPQVDGTVRNDLGKVAYAPPGSKNAAVNGVQEDASGHVDSVGTDNSSKSGTRI